MRFGENVECDDVFEAVGSGDLQQMLKVIELPTNAVERHHLLNNIVHLTNRRFLRGEATNETLLSYAELHWRELPYLLAEMARHDRLSRAAWRIPPMPFKVPGIDTPFVLVDCYVRAGREVEAACIPAQWAAIVADCES